MKLVSIVKYVFKIKRNKIVLYFSLLLLSLCIHTQAQTYKIDFKNETLSGALIKASEYFQIKVAFDAQKAGEVYITKQVTGNTPEEFMKNLLSGLSFEYTFKHKRYLVFDKSPGALKDTLSCQLLGTITDNESGEQLPYAAILLPELNLNTYASASGSFSFKNVQSNPFRITINFIGYTPLDTLIRWNNPNLHYNFQLKRKIQIIDTVVVNSPKLEMIDFRNDVDFGTTINTSKLIDLPILAETDIFRTLQLLPGISYSENSSELSIHGGSSDQNLILFDGQTLYNLSHYYGVISSLNPNVIKDVQVFKGGYDSRYGERVSGIVDITAKSGNQLKTKIYGDLNLVSGNITAEVPLGKKISLVAAFRRSYSDIYATEFANSLFKNNVIHFRSDSNEAVSISTPSFRFYDFNTKLTYKLSSKEYFSLSAYGGKDFFSNTYTQNTHSLVVDNIDNNNWSNYGISASWLRQWNTSFYSDLQIGASGYSNNYYNKTSIDQTNSPLSIQPSIPNQVFAIEANDENRLGDISISLKNSYTLNDKHQMYFGALLRQNSIYYHKDADKIYVYDNIDQANLISSVYFLDKINLNEIITFKPGFRLNYYDGTKKLYLEPRAAMGIDISPKASLRIAFGRYFQYINQVATQQETGYMKNFWVLADGLSHPVLASNHYVVGSNFGIGDFLFDAEVYYKHLSGIQEYFSISHLRKIVEFKTYFPSGGQLAPAAGSQPSFFIKGNGKAYGLDFLVQYKKKNFTSWLSYSLSRSLHSFDAVNNGNEIPAPTDQLHQLSFTEMVTVGKWNFSTITMFATGRPYFISGDLSDDSVVQFYQRLPNYFRIDVSANYTFNIASSQFKIGASIVNILNTQNFFDINTRDINFETTSFSQTNLIRSKARSLNLYMHFNF